MKKVCALLFLTLVPVAAAGALVWPGSGACGGTLQACIDSAAAGDTVQVATNTPVGEDLTIAKSLTLEPAPAGAPSVVGQITLLSSAAATIQPVMARDYEAGKDRR